MVSKYTYREANFAANYLISLGFHHDLGVVVYQDPLQGCIPWMQADTRGVTYHRSCLMQLFFFPLN